MSEEHLELPDVDLLPLLHEMRFARAVGGSAAGRRLRPVPAAFGDAFRWPATAGESWLMPEGDVVTVVVARYDEDVGWLSSLPQVDGHHRPRSVVCLCVGRAILLGGPERRGT